MSYHLEHHHEQSHTEGLHPDIVMTTQHVLAAHRIAHLILPHLSPLATAQEKTLALRAHEQQIYTALQAAHLLKPGQRPTDVIGLPITTVSFTFTQSATRQSHQGLITSYVMGDERWVSDAVKRQVAEACGGNEPVSNRDIKGMKLGAQSGVSLDQLGVVHGTVSPLVRPGMDIQRFFIMRPIQQQSDRELTFVGDYAYGTRKSWVILNMQQACQLPDLYAKHAGITPVRYLTVDAPIMVAS